MEAALPSLWAENCFPGPENKTRLNFAAVAANLDCISLLLYAILVGQFLRNFVLNLWEQILVIYRFCELITVDSWLVNIDDACPIPTRGSCFQELPDSSCEFCDDISLLVDPNELEAPRTFGHLSITLD